MKTCSKLDEYLCFNPKSGWSLERWLTTTDVVLLQTCPLASTWPMHSVTWRSQATNLPDYILYNDEIKFLWTMTHAVAGKLLFLANYAARVLTSSKWQQEMGWENESQEWLGCRFFHPFLVAANPAWPSWTVRLAILQAREDSYWSVWLGPSTRRIQTEL
jgi:hypothetical protein